MEGRQHGKKGMQSADDDKRGKEIFFQELSERVT